MRIAWRHNLQRTDKMNPYLNLSRNILRSNFGRLPFPYKLTFAITYRCNYRCRICNIWKRDPAEELTLDEFERFFKKSNGFNWIDFTGGEVWLRKDFTGIIEAAIRNCRNLLMLHFPTYGYRKLHEELRRRVPLK